MCLTFGKREYLNRKAAHTSKLTYLKKSPANICSAGLFAIFVLTNILFSMSKDNKDFGRVQVWAGVVLTLLMIFEKTLDLSGRLNLGERMKEFFELFCIIGASVSIGWYIKIMQNRIKFYSQAVSELPSQIEKLEGNDSKLESVILLLFEKLEGQMTEQERLQFWMNLRPEEAKNIFNNKVNAEKFIKKVKEDNQRRGSYL